MSWWYCSLFLVLTTMMILLLKNEVECVTRHVMTDKVTLKVTFQTLIQWSSTLPRSFKVALTCLASMAASILKVETATQACIISIKWIGNETKSKVKHKTSHHKQSWEQQTGSYTTQHIASQCGTFCAAISISAFNSNHSFWMAKYKNIFLFCWDLLVADILKS